MLAHKYLSLTELPQPDVTSKQHVMGIELCRLFAHSYTVPVVATAERDRIVLSWWSSARGRWECHVREHEPLEVAGTTAEAATAWNGSKSVGLAADRRYVCLAYKRTLVGQDEAKLWVEVFEWQDESHRLAPLNNIPKAVPLPGLGFHRAGFHVWAGLHPARGLMLLLQTVVVEGGQVLPETWDRVELTLLNANPTANLAAAASWSASTIDEGGWDLDALLEGDTLTCVYRRTPYALELLHEVGSSGTVELDVPSDTSTDDGYVPLTLRRLPLDGGSSVHREDLPGGFDPRIQRTAPRLMLTVDRPAGGTIRLTTESMELEPEVTAFRRLFVREGSGGWHRRGLASYAATLLPRSFSELYGVPPAFAALHPRRASLDPEAGTIVAGFGTLHGYLPAFVVGWSAGAVPDEHRRYEQLDLLQHHPIRGTVEVVRLRVDPDQPGLDSVEEAKLQILDLNLTQIPAQLDPEGAVAGSAEDAQFVPIQSGEIAFDNTIGGCLQVDRTTRQLQFYAYTDLGDGGVRVIYDEELPPPEPTEAYPGKSQAVRFEHFAGTLLGDEEWVELSGFGAGTTASSYNTARSLGSGVETGIGSGPPRSLVNGLQARLDTLLQHLQDIGGETVEGSEGPWWVLEEAEAAVFDAHLGPVARPTWDLLWGLYERFEVGDGDQAPTFWASMGALSIESHRVAFRRTERGERTRLAVQRKLELGTPLQLIGAAPPAAQGSIVYDTTLEYGAWEIEIDGVVGFFMDSDFIGTKAAVSRSFTPAILVREERGRRPLTAAPEDPGFEVVRGLSCSLAAKPIGPTAAKLHSDGACAGLIYNHVTTITVAVVVGALIALGLAFLIPGFLALLAFIPLPVLVASVIWKMAQKAQRRITRRLESLDFKAIFDDVDFLSHAGEGVAEGLARRVCEATDAMDPAENADGRQRFRDQVWQKILVYSGKAAVVIRPPA